MTDKPIESVVVPESEAEIYSEEEGRFILNSKSNWYILDALGNRVYYLTRNRADAQRQADLDYDGRYKIRAVKDQKSKSKQESGGLSCSGSNSRKGFGSWLKKS
ncbi:hypothetical protein [Pseudomonas phage vB_PsaM_M1]|nr:hypothetical protein [Pseudomonas phage vB_PsaM_M1]